MAFGRPGMLTRRHEKYDRAWLFRLRTSRSDLLSELLLAFCDDNAIYRNSAHRTNFSSLQAFETQLLSRLHVQGSELGVKTAARVSAQPGIHLSGGLERVNLIRRRRLSSPT